jgi:hypothetical protein
MSDQLTSVPSHDPAQPPARRAGHDPGGRTVVADQVLAGARGAGSAGEATVTSLPPKRGHPMNGSLLVAGGYGVVGEQIAEVLRARHADLPITVAGRVPERGEALDDRLGAACVAPDVGEPDRLRGSSSRSPAAGAARAPP